MLFGLGLGLTMSTIIGGFPALASLPFAFVPPAARLIAKCTCDLVLVLSAAFTRKGKFVTKQDFEESVGQYCAKRTGLGAKAVRTLVHNEIDRLIPIHTVKVYEPLSTMKMRTEFRRIIAGHRFSLDEEFIPAPEEENAEVAVRDVRGLDQWMEQREKSLHGGSFFSDSASTSRSPSLPQVEQTVRHMKSLEQAMYDIGNKPLPDPPQAPQLVELPGTTVVDPWNGGLSELADSQVGNMTHRWHPGMVELP